MKVQNTLIVNKITLSLVSLIALIQPAFSQYTKAPLPANASIVGTAQKSEEFHTPLTGEIHTLSADLRWRPILSTVRNEQGKEDDSLLTYTKNQKTIEKLRAAATHRENGQESAEGGINPVIGTNFQANLNNGMSPMDNSVAISNGGIIISVANTTIDYFDIGGTNIYTNDIVTFIGDPSITDVCDPVVIYDSGLDRFVFFCQVCPFTSATSQLLIFFSKSNNPVDGWWYYHLPGNILANGTGFDYPKLGLSNNELYITGNLYADGGSYNQSILFQITKAGGFSGGTLNYQYWNAISGNPFTLLPLSWGQQGNYGPGVYLIATKSGGGSTIDFYDLTDDMTASGEVLNHYSVSTTAYSAAGDGSQLGSSVLIDNGDCRTLSGFYLNGTAHFVFHSDYGGGYCGLNYNRLDVSTKTNSSTKFGLTNYEYAYPAVASYGSAITDKAVMIGFVRTGASIYPEMRVVNCDATMAWSSSVLVKSGESFVSYTGNPERWGDYTGMCRKHNSGSPSVWMNGMYGNTSNRYDCWVAQIGGVTTGMDNSAVLNNSKIYPNPVNSTFSMEFDLKEPVQISISVYDINGRLVKSLYEGMSRPGLNNFRFNKANLLSGTYFVTVSTDNKILKNERIVISE